VSRWLTPWIVIGGTAASSSKDAEIVAFLTRKWRRELDYRLIKELWVFAGDRIAVRFAYEFHDDSGNWFRAYGNDGSSTGTA
jgi:nuclear transport factor 2 (NTF2) superfamily protein